MIETINGLSRVIIKLCKRLSYLEEYQKDESAKDIKKYLLECLEKEDLCCSLITGQEDE